MMFLRKQSSEDTYQYEYLDQTSNAGAKEIAKAFGKHS